MKLITTLSLVTCALGLHHLSNAQFAPVVGQPGTTAVFKDSSAFIAWATKGTLVRGLQDISVPTNGNVNVGDSTSAFGKAGTTGVVSLGDGGYAIMQFDKPISDGAGPDLAVFENGFNDTFLELAFVEASSDGIHFFRFPATSNSDASVQTGSFGATDATKINNLAGKYRANYGTPFDLNDIANDVLLNKTAITHIKIIDVVGCIQPQYCTRDKNNAIINDPWPTAFGSSGFDLDAVGVIHEQITTTTGITELSAIVIHAYPNPVTDELFISVGSNTNYTTVIMNLMGEIMLQVERTSNTSSIVTSNLKQGVYILEVTMGNQKKQLKFIKS